MDTATRLIFMEIMIHARNEDMQYPDFIMHGNKHIAYQLKRGQSLFLSSNFKKIGFTRSALERSFKLLSNKNNAINMTFTRKPFGFIISINNYDDLTSFAFNSEIIQQSYNNHTAIIQRTNNKSVKNDKNVETDQSLPTPQKSDSDLQISDWDIPEEEIDFVLQNIARWFCYTGLYNQPTYFFDKFELRTEFEQAKMFYKQKDKQNKTTSDPTTKLISWFKSSKNISVPKLNHSQIYQMTEEEEIAHDLAEIQRIPLK